MTSYVLEQHSAISCKMNTFLDLAPFWPEKTLRLYQCGFPNIRKTLVQGKMTEYCPSTHATPDIKVLLMCCRRKTSPPNIVWGQREQHYTRSLRGWCSCLHSDLLCLKPGGVGKPSQLLCEQFNASGSGIELQASPLSPGQCLGILGFDVARGCCDYKVYSIHFCLYLHLTPVVLLRPLSPSKPHKSQWVGCLCACLGDRWRTWVWGPPRVLWAPSDASLGLSGWIIISLAVK